MSGFIGGLNPYYNELSHTYANGNAMNGSVQDTKMQDGKETDEAEKALAESLPARNVRPVKNENTRTVLMRMFLSKQLRTFLRKLRQARCVLMRENMFPMLIPKQQKKMGKCYLFQSELKLLSARNAGRIMFLGELRLPEFLIRRIQQRKKAESLEWILKEKTKDRRGQILISRARDRYGQMR